LQLTDQGFFEAGSAFDNTRVDVRRFSTRFSFQLTDANADGFTFTIQGSSPFALGPFGMALGYSDGVSGIGQHSLAVKFDLFDTAGEGFDSTGLYLNGAPPTVPAIDLSSTGIDLHSGDIFNVAMTYDGGTLKVTETDTVTGAAATQSYSVNIPGIIGDS